MEEGVVMHCSYLFWLLLLIQSLANFHCPSLGHQELYQEDRILGIRKKIEAPGNGSVKFSIVSSGGVFPKSSLLMVILPMYSGRGIESRWRLRKSLREDATEASSLLQSNLKDI